MNIYHQNNSLTIKTITMRNLILLITLLFVSDFVVGQQIVNSVNKNF